MQQTKTNRSSGLDMLTYNTNKQLFCEIVQTTAERAIVCNGCRPTDKEVRSIGPFVGTSEVDLGPQRGSACPHNSRANLFGAALERKRHVLNLFFIYHHLAAAFDRRVTSFDIVAASLGSNDVSLRYLFTSRIEPFDVQTATRVDLNQFAYVDNVVITGRLSDRSRGCCRTWIVHAIN